MKKYNVKVDFCSENALASVARFDEEAVIEMDSICDDGHEMYTVVTRYDIDSLLDNAAGVIEYGIEWNNDR